MIFSYDGLNFKGYQKQKKERTVQGEMEKVLRKINSNKKVVVVASGRTDAGVHAINQRAHFELETKFSIKGLTKAINGLLPNDIFVKKIEKIKGNFHARFDVVRKDYYYKINIGEYNPMERNYVYQHGDLNLMEVERGLKYFEGTHNFKSFTKAEEEMSDYNRTIYHTVFEKEGEIITLKFSANGFMRHMVRNMVGLLIEIGEGKKDSSDIMEILELKDRTKSGITAPACGLYLSDVFYEWFLLTFALYFSTMLIGTFSTSCMRWWDIECNLW